MFASTVNYAIAIIKVVGSCQATISCLLFYWTETRYLVKQVVVSTIIIVYVLWLLALLHIFSRMQRRIAQLQLCKSDVPAMSGIRLMQEALLLIESQPNINLIEHFLDQTIQ